MTEANVVTLPTPAPRAPVAPPPAPPAAAPVDDGITTAGWLREMREMRREQQTEREHQTAAFVSALDKLGARIDVSVGDLRVEMRRHLTVLVTTFIVAFVVLAALAGGTIYLKGFGVTASTAAATPETP